MLSPVARYILAVHALVLGLGYLLGPPQWYSGGTFSVVRSLGVPISVWGVAFLIVGLLLLARKHTAGHAMGVLVFVFWGLGLAASLKSGQLSGWGSPIHNLLLAAPLHALGLWRRAQSRVDARTDHE
ncbi:hypothetical protein BBK82_03410 [Lentzea guizhouensis]|uniref:Uncharacterized protein n=1 Tax=Lentzea guizhouensis TaxID=1586287 RepID=A0A1B2HC26_9PSEU|nr:hypothetical protein [Lentzea guizhouensis]ANZ35263.1 hypothetical protein BBK82_03410 [Lentzea guizhouensis]